MCRRSGVEAPAPSCDVVILGSGPAGVAAALALKQVEPGVRVLLVEAEPHGAWRVGETLAPGTRQILEGLGCWEAVAQAGALESFQSIAAWGSDRPHENEFMFSTRGNAVHVDRARFDEALRAAAEAAGAVLWRPAHFQTAEQRADRRWRLRLSRDGKSCDVLSDTVIDATGRRARFAATQGSRPRFTDRLVGIAGLVKLPPEEAPCDRSTMVEARETGWWYSSPVPGGRLVLVWMSDTDLVHRASLTQRPRWLAHLQDAPITRERARGKIPDLLSTWPARSHSLDSVCGPHWVAAGDAAASWDPLSSAGILKALRTGKLAAFAILDLLRGVEGGMAKYQRIVEADNQRYQRDKREIYRQERRWHHSPFWRRRHDDADLAENSEYTIGLEQTRGS
jgi:flavin-dependent dehydrogenase